MSFLFINFQVESSDMFNAWVTFCETTTLHGFLDIHTSKNFFWKFVWTVLLVVCAGWMIYECNLVLDDYRRMPIATDYQVYSEKPAFPVVVVCNSNGINSSRVMEQNLSPEHVNAARKFSKDTVLMEEDNILENISFSADVNIVEVMMSIGFDQDKFIKKCTFNGIECRPNNVHIEQQFDAEYGRCFSITTENQDQPSIGLSLLIDLHTELSWTHYPFAFDGVSVKIMPSFSPLTFDEILIPPGYQSRIVLKSVEYTFATSNKGEETKCANDILRRIFKKFNYSATLCSLDCIYERMVDVCGCVLPRLDPETLTLANLTACNGLGMKSLKCAHEVRRNMQIICTDRCLPACRQKSYEKSISFNRYPSNSYLNYLKKYDNSNESVRYRDNHIILHIAFDELTVTKIKQFPSMNINSFISQIGGLCGLFLGASLLSLAQIIIQSANALMDGFKILIKKKNKE